MKNILSFSFLLCGVLAFSEAAKILGIFPFPGRSQYIFAEPYFKALAGRGHEVTVISAFPQDQPIANFTDIPLLDILKLMDDVKLEFYFTEGVLAKLNFLSDYAVKVTKSVFEDRGVQHLMQSKQRFDMLVVETIYTEALYGFAEHFGAHLIGVSTFGTIASIDDLVGNTSPISYIPKYTEALTDRMNYLQRLNNLFNHIVDYLHFCFYHLPIQKAIHRKYFPEAQYNLLDVRTNFSLILLNQHFTLSFPRPYVPNIIEVGGMHIRRKNATLPIHMQRFLDESDEHGVIYFSMGTNVKSNTMPREKLEIILRTFSALKQRVMWKYEDENLPGKPDNVLISKWFPQTDILAHPKVKLFITHGGLLGFTESIYHGKPVLGMPIFFDQFLNMERVKTMGFGLGIDYKQLTEQDFKEKIQEVLSKPKYTDMAQLLSKRYHDQPMEPIEKAIFWTEYVLRHNGAKHMRNAALDLNFIQYYSIDTILVLAFGVVLIMVFLSCLIIKFLLFALCTNTNKEHKKKTN